MEGEGRRKSGTVMGVDVHRNVLAVCIVSGKNILEESGKKNDEGGVKEVIGLCRKFSVESVAMESTAQYHMKLMYTLLEKGIQVLLANPQQTRETQGKKTDRFDARRIAVAHKDGRLKPSVISPEETMQLRKNMRAVLRLTSEQTKSKQRLQQLFHRHDFTLHKKKGENKGFLEKKWPLTLSSSS